MDAQLHTTCKDHTICWWLTGVWEDYYKSVASGSAWWKALVSSGHVVQHYINNYHVPMVDCTCPWALYLCTRLRFLYFTWVLSLHATFYFISTSFQSWIFNFRLHYIAICQGKQSLFLFWLHNGRRGSLVLWEARESIHWRMVWFLFGWSLNCAISI